jgi:mannose-1-phosphate guanylyltransferase
MIRNTAPRVAYGATKITQINPEATIIVAPSNHTIANPDAFVAAIEQSLKAASENNCLITLGIKPSRPYTGYGYIQYTEEMLPGDSQIFKVGMFTENPDLESAKSFVQSGNFLWNAGIFIWSVKSINAVFQKYLPDTFALFQARNCFFNTSEETMFIQKTYQECASLSIDIGIIEKAENVYVLPAEFGWSDLGTWASVYDMAEKDYVGNAVVPSKQVKMINSSNCMVSVPKEKLVILQELDDYIVLESNNTLLLICPRPEEQSVKQIVAEVKLKLGDVFI